jgi:hypothetical protein
MDPVDILEMAAHAARMIRSSADPEALLAEACWRVGCRAPEPGEPLSVRLTRLVEEADERRTELLEFLRQHLGPLYLNRPDEGWKQAGGEVEVYEPDPEVPELLAYVKSEQAKSRCLDLFEGHFPPFAVAERRAVHYVDDEAEDLPAAVRGLIDYPLHKPVLFPIEVGEAPWNVWDICCAFADQYARIYEQAERFDVWGHDLSDLWIERLFYYPERRLIYPGVGS